jgi:hypothetical protein
VSSPYRRSAGCTIAISPSRPDGTDYGLPLVARRPVTASSANPRIDGRLDPDHATAAYRQLAARVGASRLVALDFHTRANFCWERIFSRDRVPFQLASVRGGRPRMGKLPNAPTPCGGLPVSLETAPSEGLRQLAGSYVRSSNLHRQPLYVSTRCKLWYPPGPRDSGRIH